MVWKSKTLKSFNEKEFKKPPPYVIFFFLFYLSSNDQFMIFHKDSHHIQNDCTYLHFHQKLGYKMGGGIACVHAESHAYVHKNLCKYRTLLFWFNGYMQIFCFSLLVGNFFSDGFLARI